MSCITLATGWACSDFRLTGSWTRMLRRSDCRICKRRDTRKPHLCCCSPTALSAQGSCCTDPHRDRGWLQAGRGEDRRCIRTERRGGWSWVVTKGHTAGNEPTSYIYLGLPSNKDRQTTNMYLKLKTYIFKLVCFTNKNFYWGETILFILSITVAGRICEILT